MNEKQAMELVSRLVKIMGPAIHRIYFDEYFATLLDNEKFDCVEDCAEDFSDAVYNVLSQSMCDQVCNIVYDILDNNSNNFKTAKCDVCGKTIIYSNANTLHKYSDDGVCRTYCNHCFEDCFVKCNRCGKYVHNEDYIPVSHEDGNDYCYCRECASYLLSKK